MDSLLERYEPDEVLAMGLDFRNQHKECLPDKIFYRLFFMIFKAIFLDGSIDGNCCPDCNSGNKLLSWSNTLCSAEITGDC